MRGREFLLHLQRVTPSMPVTYLFLAKHGHNTNNAGREWVVAVVIVAKQESSSRVNLVDCATEFQRIALSARQMGPLFRVSKTIEQPLSGGALYS